MHGASLWWFASYFSVCVQLVKVFLVPVLRGITQFWLLFYVNAMPLLVQHETLLQFADDTYIALLSV